MAYSPFSKALGQPLIEDDIDALVQNEVSEGYHVEYKSDFPENRKIGRSIASFANTYGGWYIVGVETDGNNVARRIDGFDPGQHRDPIAKVREVAKEYIDPVPVFVPQVVELASGRLVLVVYVPAEQETPFVSKDGRIYRRNHDASDPVPENDRYTLDRLFVEGQGVASRFERFCVSHWQIAFPLGSSGAVELYFSPYPLDVTPRADLLSADRIDRLLHWFHSVATPVMGGTIISRIRFEHAWPTADSVILLSTHDAAAPNEWIIAELFTDSRAIFRVPLRYLDITSSSVNDLSSYDASVGLRNARLGARSIWDFQPKFFSAPSLWKEIGAVIDFLFHWLADEPPHFDLQAAVRVTDAAMSVLFMEGDLWGNYVLRWGPPILTRNSCEIPRGIGRGLRFAADQPVEVWAQLCETLSLVFGVPPEYHRPMFQKVRVRGG